MSIGNTRNQHFANGAPFPINDHICNTPNKVSYPSMKRQHDEEIMDLLHEFNDIKDACQTVLGALANLEQCTIKEMHLKYNLPLKE